MAPGSVDWPWRPEDLIVPAGGLENMSAEHIASAAARCFRGEDGDRLLAYLKALTLNRALGPAADDAALRHLEGQRHLVRHLCTLIDLGRDGPDIPPTSKGDEL
jgi:hypothetical protein